MRHDAIETCRPTPEGERRAAMESSQVTMHAWRMAPDGAARRGPVLH